MSIKPFLLSFTATALLAAPFLLEADAPPQLAEVKIAPAPGMESVVNGLTFHSTVVKRKGKTATLQVTALNPSSTPIHTEVTAELMMMPSSSPMARMVPPPRELAATPLAVDLAPGKKMVQTITVALPADAVAALDRAEKPQPKGANEIPAEMMARPPRLYTMVREIQKPVKAQRVSAN